MPSTGHRYENKQAAGETSVYEKLESYAYAEAGRRQAQQLRQAAKCFFCCARQRKSRIRWRRKADACHREKFPRLRPAARSRRLKRPSFPSRFRPILCFPLCFCPTLFVFCVFCRPKQRSKRLCRRQEKEEIQASHKQIRRVCQNNRLVSRAEHCAAYCKQVGSAADVETYAHGGQSRRVGKEVFGNQKSRSRNDDGAHAHKPEGNCRLFGEPFQGFHFKAEKHERDSYAHKPRRRRFPREICRNLAPKEKTQSPKT